MRAAAMPSQRSIVALWDYLRTRNGQTELRRTVPDGNHRFFVLEALRDGRAVGLVHPRGFGSVAVVELSGSNEEEILNLRTLDPSEDAQLAGAQLLRDHARLARRLRPVLGRIEAVQLVAYHPGRRLVLRVEGDGHRGDGAVYVKLLRKSAYRRAAEVIPKLPDLPDELRFAEVDAWLAEDHAFVSREVRGTSLHALLRGAKRVDLASLTALAQLASTEPGLELPLHDFEAERGATLKMLDHSAPLMPELVEIADLVRALPRPSEPTPRLLHRDLHDKQVFFTATGLALIDCEGASRGDPRIDLVNLSEHLRLRALQDFRARGGAQIGCRLLFEAGLIRDDEETRLLRALARARLAGVYARRPAWTELARRLGEESTRLMRGLA